MVDEAVDCGHAALRVESLYSLGYQSVLLVPLRRLGQTG